MNLDEIEKALAEYREADKTGMDLALKSYRLDRLLHNNAEELVRRARIGERVQQHMIPVTTQMPPKDVTVLGLNLDGELEDVQYRDERQCMLGTRAGECGEGFVSIAAGYLPVDGITHWLPKESQS